MVYLSTAGCESKWRLLYRGISILVCIVCLSRLWCAATMFTKYCGSLALEKLSSLCMKLILNRDQLVKYLGFPMPELEIIYSICAKGCRKIRDAEFLEDIRYVYRFPHITYPYSSCTYIRIRVLFAAASLLFVLFLYIFRSCSSTFL